MIQEEPNYAETSPHRAVEGGDNDENEEVDILSSDLKEDVIQQTPKSH